MHPSHYFALALDLAYNRSAISTIAVFGTPCLRDSVSMIFKASSPSRIPTFFFVTASQTLDSEDGTPCSKEDAPSNDALRHGSALLRPADSRTGPRAASLASYSLPREGRLLPLDVQAESAGPAHVTLPLRPVGRSL